MSKRKAEDAQTDKMATAEKVPQVTENQTNYLHINKYQTTITFAE